MDSDRPHFGTTSTGSSSTATTELFISLTSRLSCPSPSMKLTKSILSPGRAARDSGPVSLSSSLSRRLRTNGSLRGGQASPFLTSTSKKRGCFFENPEPSSPKVTCIGQLRVKTKKKERQSRSLSRRRSGEASFGKIERAASADGEPQNEDKVYTQQQRGSSAGAHYQQPQQRQECLPRRNQRWVHLPVSICEALRAFGAEFSCLFPCRSSCFSTSAREKAEKQTNRSARDENRFAAVFARWLVSLNDGEGGPMRKIEMVVGGGDVEGKAKRMSMRSSRRHVFEDIEVKDDRIEVKRQSMEGEEEAGRVSICIPPKNALLLMRCRSDPMKMAALANRFSWDAHAAPENEDIEERVEVGLCEGTDKAGLGRDVVVAIEPNEEQEITEEAEAGLAKEVGDLGRGEEIQKEELVVGGEEIFEEKEVDELRQEILGNLKALVAEEGEEVEPNVHSSFGALLDQENTESSIHYEEEVEDSTACHSSPSAGSDDEEIEGNEASGRSTYTAEKDATFVNNDYENRVTDQPEKIHAEDGETTLREDGEEEQTAIPTEAEIKSRDNQQLITLNRESKKEKQSPALPECLLLMMREPKLSMEVSKETWVCSRDYIRWPPERPRKPAGWDHVSVKRRLSIDSKLHPTAHSSSTKNNDQQPIRSPCWLPAAVAATLTEQKLVNAVAHDPFVLTRCKSEPMRTAAAKLVPQSCFWKNAMRKLEPHRRATPGVGL